MLNFPTVDSVRFTNATTTSNSSNSNISKYTSRMCARRPNERQRNNGSFFLLLCAKSKLSEAKLSYRVKV